MAPPSAIDIVDATGDMDTITPVPLTVNGVPARRAKSGKFVGGTAAPGNSDSFKAPVSEGLLPGTL